MRKRVIMGDPHGRWGAVSHIYLTEKPDDVIILGDYFDSFDIHPIDQKMCYDNIINLKKMHEDKCGADSFILLIGNHDMHYLNDYNGQHSGYNFETVTIAGYRIERDICNKQLRYVYIDKLNRTIYSHAGVSMKWLEKWCDGKIENINNDMSYHAFEFTYRDNGDFFGSSVYNGPTWIRPEGLLKNPYKDELGVWNQVFGHTESLSPKRFACEDGGLFCIDCITRCYMVEMIDDDGKIISRELVDNKMFC